MLEVGGFKRYWRGYWSGIDDRLGMDDEEGKEGDTNQVSGFITWVESDPLRRWGTYRRETLAEEEGEDIELCLGYIHFDFA